MARKVHEITSSFESIAPTGITPEERLASIATAILHEVLAAETVGLCRASVAEARRFPDLAASVSRMGRERGAEAVAHLLGELPEFNDVLAFAADRPAATARQSIELIVQPMMMRALFGEDLTALRAEIVRMSRGRWRSSSPRAGMAASTDHGNVLLNPIRATSRAASRPARRHARSVPRSQSAPSTPC
jgi:hypothetical protein